MASSRSIDATKMVRILRAGIADFDKNLVVRGNLDPISLPLLKVDTTYQREALSAKLRQDLFQAISDGARLPDLDLALRGTDEYEVEPNGTTMGLNGPVYIVDGHQRWQTVLDYRKQFGVDIYLGCSVTLNTSVEFERRRFLDLGLNRRKISASLLLRDHKEEIPLIGTMYGLTNGGEKKPMVLNGRVAWDQIRSNDDLINGMQLCEVALWLHNHLTPVSHSAKEIPDLLRRLESLMPLRMFRQNIATFWNALDDAWHFSELKTNMARTVLKLDIVRILAQIMSEHENFWKPPQSNHELYINAEMVKRLRLVDTRDLQLIFTGSGINKSAIKSAIIIELDKGKSVQRLRKRDDRGWRDAAE